MINKLKKQFT